MNQILMFRYLCSTFLLLMVLVSKTTTQGRVRCSPSGIQIAADILGLLDPKYQGRESTQHEFNASVDFSSFLLEGDYGWGSIKWKGYDKTTGNGSSYTSNGQYFRIGLNYNLLRDMAGKDLAFLGFRYARSYFEDRLVSKVSYDSRGPIKNVNFLIDSEQDDVTARWLEAVAGLKVKVWKMLYVGGTIRYKFGLRFDRAGYHIPYEVLGWGLNGSRGFGLNLYVSLYIPFTRHAMHLV